MCEYYLQITIQIILIKGNCNKLGGGKAALRQDSYLYVSVTYIKSDLTTDQFDVNTCVTFLFNECEMMIVTF